MNRPAVSCSRSVSPGASSAGQAAAAYLRPSPPDHTMPRELVARTAPHSASGCGSGVPCVAESVSDRRRKALGRKPESRKLIVPNGASAGARPSLNRINVGPLVLAGARGSPTKAMVASALLLPDASKRIGKAVSSAVNNRVRCS
jgi:hypothetical protein